MPSNLIAAARVPLAAFLIALAPALAFAQSPPPAAKPPLAEPPSIERPDGQPIPDVEMPTPQLPGAIEEEGEQAMPGEGCPYRGNKLELIV